MSPKFKEYCDSLEAKIQASYTEGATLDEAEKLAGEFLKAQLRISEELKTADLDARMRKTSVKAIKAGVYMANATKTEKKPSDAMLQAQVDMDAIVTKEQDAFDTLEADRDNLERYYNVFRESHMHFRNIAKGRFE